MKFIALNRFALIEEGRLQESVDEALEETCRKLISHVRKFGPKATAKAKAEISIKLALQFDGTGCAGDNVEGGDFSIKGAISVKYPGRPANVTRAVHGQEQDGSDVLWVRQSGSDGDSPRQMKLATDDGRVIDPATGEVAPPVKGKKKAQE